MHLGGLGPLHGAAGYGVLAFADLANGQLPSFLSHSRADATQIATYVGSDGLLKTVAAAGAPRFDFTPGRKAGLLLEGARTNSLTNSNNFAAWPTSEQITHTVAAGVSPSGASDAVKTDELAVNATHRNIQGIALAAGDYVVSRWFKQAERQWAALQIITDTATNRFSVLIDLATGAIIATNSNGAPIGVAYGSTLYANGWVRAFVKATHTAGNVSHVAAGANSAAPSWAVPAAVPAYLGVVATGVLNFGAQLEAGGYPTSYAATTAAAVARAADTVSMAALGTEQAIVQKTDLATGARSRQLFNPASGISALAECVVEKIALYRAGEPNLANKLVVDGAW